MHILEMILHSAKDTWPLIPFLYLTYLLMELLERRAGDKAERIIRSAGKAGPLLGGLLGAVPSCGFSAAGAGFYSARLITPGTLIALFSATSDEMLTVMLPSGEPLSKMALLVGIKAAVGIAVGFLVDLILRLSRKRAEERDIGAICREGACHCEGRSVWLAALIHTATVILVVFLVSLVLHFLIHFVGNDTISKALNIHPLLSCAIAALVGMIPNCASSVVLTQLYIQGAITAGTLLAGLIPGAGAGILVLMRVNKPIKNTVWILTVLFLAGLLVGTATDLTGLGELIDTL